MEYLFSDLGKYNQTFPPPNVCSPDSPEYLLLSQAPGKKRRQRKRGSRSGIQDGLHGSPSWATCPGVCGRFLFWMSAVASVLPHRRLPGSTQPVFGSQCNAGVMNFGILNRFLGFPSFTSGTLPKLEISCPGVTLKN
ncbi:hypothetical protein AMECASPLE_035143 [Ameca splendens]|uniref:Uncharacterized protein n=1 Tax=Ameca splendens TaxID=208324 RepID=A0ABV0Z646_9TELE